MKSDNRNYFQQLGIKTPEDVTDKEIDEAYFEKMLELYLAIRGKKEKVPEDKKEEREDEYKEELYNKMRNAPSTKAGIVLLDRLIDELGDTKQEKVNYQLQIAKYREAYDKLRYEKSRNEYWRKTVKEKASEFQLEDLIKKYGGDPKDKLETYYINEGSHPLKVRRKENIVPYEVQYEDAEINISVKNSIVFENNLAKDELTEYLLLMKGEENTIFGYTVQGRIIIPELENPKYRGLLYKAILQNKREGKTYFGEVGKIGDKYVIKKDRVHELAVEQMEEMEKKERREKNEVNQGDEAR